MKAIQTQYKGYRFRSRLEARWAVFFDTLGLPWEYEPEGFEFPGGVRYLPDFKVLYPGSDWEWFEVKPDLHLTTPGEWAKLLAFGEKEHLTLLDGVPAMRTYSTVGSRPADDEYRFTGSHIPCLPDRKLLKHVTDPKRQGVVLWCGKERLWYDNFGDVFEVDQDCTIGDDALAELQRAVDTARGHRFGHGGRA